MKLFPAISLFLILLSAIFIVGAISVQAKGEDECPGGSICIPNPLKYDTIEGILCAITNFLAALAFPAAAVAILWGGIQLIVGYSTGEKEERVNRGKKTIMWAVIGFAIVQGVNFIVEAVLEVMGGTGGSPCK